jgi:hypothetical protein
MNLFHDFFSFFFVPIALAVDAPAGGGGGDGGTPAGGAPSGGAPAPSGGTAAPAGGAPAAPAGGAPAVSGPILGQDGKFVPGWSKVLGGTDALEAKFTDPKALVGSYLSLEKMISSKGIIKPGPNATPEEKAAYFNALGRPEKPEGYAIKMPEKIGDKPFPKELWSDAQAADFAKYAHERGMLPEHVNAVVEYDAQRAVRAKQEQADAESKAQSDAITALKAEWGTNYDTNLKLAQEAAKQAGGDELLGHALANDPVFIKAMAKVGKMIVETPAAAARGTSHAATNPDAQIKAIMADKNHPWHAHNANKDPKAHKDAVLEMQRLYKLKHGEAT